MKYNKNSILSLVILCLNFHCSFDYDAELFLQSDYIEISTASNQIVEAAFSHFLICGNSVAESAANSFSLVLIVLDQPSCHAEGCTRDRDVLKKDVDYCIQSIFVMPCGCSLINKGEPVCIPICDINMFNSNRTQIPLLHHN